MTASLREQYERYAAAGGRFGYDQWLAIVHAESSRPARRRPPVRRERQRQPLRLDHRRQAAALVRPRPRLRRGRHRVRPRGRRVRRGTLWVPNGTEAAETARIRQVLVAKYGAALVTDQMVSAVRQGLAHA